MFNKKQRFFSGFTLIEVLVTLGIVAILSYSLLGYNRSSEKINVLNRYSQRLLTDLRTAQNMAIQTQQYDGQSVQGWGVHFDPSTYKIFADLSDGSRAYLEPVNLPSYLSLNSSISDIVFKPPLGDIIDNEGNSISEATITISFSSFSKTISVTKIGNISLK